MRRNNDREDKKTVPKIGTTMLAIAAGLIIATVPAALRAADTKVVSPSKGEMAQAAPESGDESSDQDDKKAAAEAFKNFQATVDVINQNVADLYDGPPFTKLESPAPRVVKVTPSAGWMKDRSMHYRNAMVLYRMWRNANQFRPVTMMITDDKGGDYITIKDTPEGLEYRAKQE